MPAIKPGEKRPWVIETEPVPLKSLMLAKLPASRLVASIAHKRATTYITARTQLRTMSSQLQYGNDSAYGSVLSERNHYSQFVHLPNGITKLSGQGGWARDGSMSADDPKGQIEQAFNNVDFVLKEAGLSGWKDVSSSTRSYRARHMY